MTQSCLGLLALARASLHSLASVPPQSPSPSNCQSGVLKGSPEYASSTGVSEINAHRIPMNFIGFGGMDVTKPYKFVWLGDVHGPCPYKFIGFRWSFIS